MALTATDWTVTILTQTVQSKRRVNHCKWELPTDGLYPSDGIPIPVQGELGMVQSFSHILISDDDSTNHVINFDKDNGTIHIRLLSTASIVAQDLVELATTATVGSTVLNTLYVDAVGW